MTVQFEKLQDGIDSASSPFGSVEIARRPGIYRNYLKRLMDSAIILISAPIVLPLIAALALVVALDGHAPIYRSSRVGKGGKPFKMLKLRTMVPGAETMLERHLASDSSAKQEWETTQKLKKDPRITPLGRFLRKSSLDELPQLWNVLMGDMSLVGPRPMLPAQRMLYPGLSYYALRPGITGLWQVSDRNDSEFAKRAEYDREYDEKLSFSCDLRLLVKTAGVVVRGTGY